VRPATGMAARSTTCWSSMFVTGIGEVVTCSPERNGELFRMLLAGLGQCGIIVRARLRLVRAAQSVAIREIP